MNELESKYRDLESFHLIPNKNINHASSSAKQKGKFIAIKSLKVHLTSFTIQTSASLINQIEFWILDKSKIRLSSSLFMRKANFLRMSFSWEMTAWVSLKRDLISTKRTLIAWNTQHYKTICNPVKRKSVRVTDYCLMMKDQLEGEF